MYIQKKVKIGACGLLYSSYVNGQRLYLGLGGGYEGSLSANSINGFIELKPVNSIFSLCYDPALLVNKEQTQRRSQFYVKLNMKSPKRACPLFGTVIRNNEFAG